MSTQTVEIPYRCDNDCVMAGCPGHVAKVTYQSTADIVSVDWGDAPGTRETYFDLNRLEALMKGLSHFTYRTEIEPRVRTLVESEVSRAVNAILDEIWNAGTSIPGRDEAIISGRLIVRLREEYKPKVGVPNTKRV